MSTIIAGRFDQQSQARQAIGALVAAGFASEHVSSFYLNPAGRHDTYPIGGDRDASPGSDDTAQGRSAGMASGAAVGAAVGAVTTPLSGPLGAVTGAFVGAHVGAVAGSLRDTEDDGEHDPYVLPHRRSGMMVAVAVEEEVQGNAVNILRSLGADDIERAEGTIADGDWEDFDPLSAATLVAPAASSSQN